LQSDNALKLYKIYSSHIGGVYSGRGVYLDYWPLSQKAKNQINVLDVYMDKYGTPARNSPKHRNFDYGIRMVLDSEWFFRKATF
jgi:hypothetical protein